MDKGIAAMTEETKKGAVSSLALLKDLLETHNMAKARLTPSGNPDERYIIGDLESGDSDNYRIRVQRVGDRSGTFLELRLVRPRDGRVTFHPAILDGFNPFHEGATLRFVGGSEATKDKNWSFGSRR